MAKQAAPTPATAPAPANPPADRPLTVSDLSKLIDGALRAGLPTSLRVLGEVSNFTDRTHWYLDLKDAESVVNCVVFASTARRTPFKPEIGQEIVATGHIELYAKSGRLSFIVEKLEPVGAGALDLAFRKLCDELKALGWFDPARKRRLPTFPRRIAVITSPQGAALQDVLVTMKRRCAAVSVLVVGVRVQGDGAAEEVTHAIRRISREHKSLGVDAILVTRGGGSREDLWAFNDRSLAEAILKSPIPVVAAIGHETDITIAELVADERGATPTQAAMRLTPDTPSLLHQLDSMLQRLTSLITRQVRFDAHRLEALARRPALTNPARSIFLARERLQAVERRMSTALRHRQHQQAARLSASAFKLETSRPSALLAASRERLAALRARLDACISTRMRSRSATLDAFRRQLDAVSPLRVLERGYSVTTTPQGQIIRDASTLKPGSTIRTRVAKGEFTSTVTNSPAAKPLSAAGPPVGPPAQPDPDQMDLF